MKKKITTEATIYLLIAFSAVCFVLSSCAKIDGHTIATTTVVKSATMVFTYNSTTYTLATPTDTVGFNTTTTPVTTITAKNAQKTLSCIFSFNANIAGSFPITTITVIIPQTSGKFTATQGNSGSVTVDTLNVNGGHISGSFSSTIPLPTTPASSGTITGKFNILQ